MGEYVEFGYKANIIGNYIPDTTQMISGKYYEATYNIGSANNEGWKTEFISNLRMQIESQPGCYFQYAYVEPNGQLRVQWLYDYTTYASLMAESGNPVPTAIPIIVVAVIIALALVAITAYFTYQIIQSIKEGVATLGPDFSIIMILIGLAAVGVVAYFLINAIKGPGKQKEHYDMLA